MSSSYTFLSLIRPILLFLAALLVLLPLRWQWRTSKLPAFALIAWLFVTNIINAVGSVVWMKENGTGLDGDMNRAALVYCDIATKIIVGSWTAVPAALLCIANRLKVASARQRSSSRTNQTLNLSRRGNFVDAVACFGVPVAFMALHYIVQDHRIDLVEVVGCQPAVFRSVPSIFIVWIPVLFLSFATLVFAGIALRSFLSTRPIRSRSISPPLNFRNISRPYTTSPPMKTRNLLLPARPSNIPQPSPPSPPYPPCLFIRLLTLVVLLSVIIICLTITDIVYVAMSGKMRSYTSFNVVHREISRVDVFFLSRRDNVDGTAQAPVHFVQLLTWTAPAPAAAYIFILTVMHWCECVRFVASIGGTGRWVRWKVARVRGWFRGEKVWEEESVRDETVNRSRSTSGSFTASVSRATTLRTSVSTLPPYTANASYTAHPFPSRPVTKPPPPPLLLTDSNYLIPHALRPSSLYGGPRQIHAPSVDEMGVVKGHKSRPSVASTYSKDMTSQRTPTLSPALTYVYRQPSKHAVSGHDSISSWASFPLASPGTMQQEYVLPEPPEAVREHARARREARESKAKRVSTLSREEWASRRSAVYRGTEFEIVSEVGYGHGHGRNTSEAENRKSKGTINAPTTSAAAPGVNRDRDDEFPVRISVGTHHVALSRVPIVSGQSVARPVPVPQLVQIPAQIAAAVAFPVPQVFEANNTGESKPIPTQSSASRRTRPVSGASTLLRSPTRSSSSGSSADVPKYHMPSRLVSPRSDTYGSDADSEGSGPGMAGVGSGRYDWGDYGKGM